MNSTNDAAGSLPAWSAVRADRQTAGRGRHGRAWVSDAGGVWLSAVVPTGSWEEGWAALPLAAGWAVCQALEALGVPRLRLRWPNDVLIGPRKLAGLLAEQTRPGLAVVGVGINGTNRPEEGEAALAGQVTRLADWLEFVPPPREVAAGVLERLREAVLRMHAGGFSAMLPRVNALWGPARRVRVEVDSGEVEGCFDGVDVRGGLCLRLPDGSRRVLEAHQVRRLRECE